MPLARPLAAVLLLAAAPALASQIFPAAVQTHLTLTYTPACALCHFNGVTGYGTVTTPFGKTLMARGALAGNEASMLGALDAMQTAATDSDGDGVSDIQELKNGTDPNVAQGADGGVGVVLPPIKYGCGASVAPGVLAALGVLALVGRRRRR